MDEQGFLHGRTCRRCAAPLKGAGSGRPAESYLGTYTGLCYPCTGAGPFLLGTYRDGAEAWEWPPSCPSWRRTRERYIKYPDCTVCDRGSNKVSRSDSQGGSYRVQCPACVVRYDGDELRTRSRVEYSTKGAALQGRFAKACKAARTRLKLAKADDLPADVRAELQEPLLREWKEWSAAHQAWIVEAGVHAFTPAEVKQV